MAFDPSEFRRVLGHWVTGVAVVASRRADGRPCGLTANSVTSLSLDPPLVLVCVDPTADSHDCIRDAGMFSVNVLGAATEPLARRFAALDLSNKFDGVDWHTAVTGAPVLDDALAWVDCRIDQVLTGGDHTIFIGEVVAADAVHGEPLLFYRGGYSRLTR
jgi:flavin reductase (DIM6/NTAB) family NADH-FMN oxidoreductase RutF